jgi:predicted nucleic acid-binding protein
LAERVVLDASAMVDLLVGTSLAGAIAKLLSGSQVHVPAHFDAEVLSALGRLVRAESLSARQAADRVRRLQQVPAERHSLPPLLVRAWELRQNLRLVDALYVALAEQLDAPLFTTDARLAAAAPAAQLIEARA